MDKCLFFVYGTLKKGYGNHNYHLSGSQFLGEFTTEPKYTLFDGGFPVVEREGETAIQGELYLCENESQINSTFQLEGCPSQIQGHKSNWYDFDKIQTPHGEAVMFVMNKNQSGRNKILKSGIWK